MKPKKFRRRNKVIKPGFQLKMAASAAIFLMIYTLVLGAAVFYPMAAEFSSTPDGDVRAQLAFSALEVHDKLWPAILCVSVVGFFGTILFSHRIAGPMYRFEKTVETLTAGDFSIRIKLRKRDEFHQFAEMINNLSTSLEKQQVAELAFRSECKELLNQLAGEPASQINHEPGQPHPLIHELMAKFEAPLKGMTTEQASIKNDPPDRIIDSAEGLTHI
jgi:hypothetical protein